MYKLLPDDERQKVAREYSLRRVAVMLQALALVLVVVIVGLFPSYILSNLRKQEVAERIRVESVGEDAVESRNLRTWLNSLNLKLKVLSPALDQERLSLVLESVLSEKSLGIKLTNFVLSKSSDKVSLSISGTASDRQSLVSFQTRLNASGDFSQVTLPVSNLAKDRNIPFQLKLVPKPKS